MTLTEKQERAINRMNRAAQDVSLGTLISEGMASQSGSSVDITGGNIVGLSNLSSGQASFGSDDDNTSFESDGTLVMSGSAVVWDDERVPVTATKLGGSKDPTFNKFKDDGEGSQGVFIYWFDKSNEKELYFSVQMPHGWNGTELRPHVHWVVESTTSGMVYCGLEYCWANIGSSFSDTNIIRAVSGSSLVVDKHYITEFDPISPTEDQNKISSMLICRVFRDASNATYDTYDADAGLLEIDFHYQIDTIGSREEYIK